MALQSQKIYNQAKLQTDKIKDPETGVRKRWLKITPPLKTINLFDKEQFAILKKKDKKKTLIKNQKKSKDLQDEYKLMTGVRARIKKDRRKAIKNKF